MATPKLSVMWLLLWIQLATLVVVCSSTDTAPINNILAETSPSLSFILTKQSIPNDVRHLRDGPADDDTDEERRIGSSITEFMC
ncbi:RxLR effector protein [Phytophthora megakarya]|uniref:RxLR effector protein n=1 Tax=Phytophthora megakarya TaxID=4795 RepID=A0A225WJ61_9STRA|nr:RxLR effector protein [Phytophthora megakarya]